MVVIIEDVDAEILVRHFCIEKEERELLEWCKKNSPRPAKVDERVASALKLKDKGNQVTNFIVGARASAFSNNRSIIQRRQVLFFC